MKKTRIIKDSIGWTVAIRTCQKLFWNFLYQDQEFNDPDYPCVFKTGKHLFWRIWWVPYLKREWQNRVEGTMQHPPTHDPFNNMKEPTFDAEGYPTIETLEAIEKWPHGDFPALVEFIKRAWRDDYGRIWNEGDEMHMATGGWSANEAIIYALQGNFMFWSTYWLKSERGGKFVLKIPTP